MSRWRHFIIITFSSSSHLHDWTPSSDVTFFFEFITMYAHVLFVDHRRGRDGMHPDKQLQKDKGDHGSTNISERKDHRIEHLRWLCYHRPHHRSSSTSAKDSSTSQLTHSHGNQKPRQWWWMVIGASTGMFGLLDRYMSSKFICSSNIVELTPQPSSLLSISGLALIGLLLKLGRAYMTPPYAITIITTRP